MLQPHGISRQLLEIPDLQLQRIKMQVGNLSRAGYYAESVPQRPRFPVNPDGKLGIISSLRCYKPSGDINDYTNRLENSALWRRVSAA